MAMMGHNYRNIVGKKKRYLTPKMQLFREKKILQFKLQPELALKQVKGKKENKLV